MHDELSLDWCRDVLMQYLSVTQISSHWSPCTACHLNRKPPPLYPPTLDIWKHICKLKHLPSPNFTLIFISVFRLTTHCAWKGWSLSKIYQKNQFLSKRWSGLNSKHRWIFLGIKQEFYLIDHSECDPAEYLLLKHEDSWSQFELRMSNEMIHQWLCQLIEIM